MTYIVQRVIFMWESLINCDTKIANLENWFSIHTRCFGFDVRNIKFLPVISIYLFSAIVFFLFVGIIAIYVCFRPNPLFINFFNDNSFELFIALPLICEGFLVGFFCSKFSMQLLGNLRDLERIFVCSFMLWLYWV